MLSIMCDICNKQILGNSCSSRAGTTYTKNSVTIHYGLNLVLSSVYGNTVEHICPDCLKDILENIANNIKQN